MNKTWKRVLALTMALGMTVGVTACGGGGGGTSSSVGGGTTSVGDSSSNTGSSEGSGAVDLTNATELKVGVFNGGLGHEWAKTLEKEFEERYANVSFEPGKTGVNVVINPQKDAFKTVTIKANITQNSSPEDIYYTCYEFYREFAKDGVALNMTDIVRENAYTADGEIADFKVEDGKVVYTNGAKSLESKMTDFHKNAFYMEGSVLDVNGNGVITDDVDIEEGYYALPYETSLTGFIYDHDLFVQMGWLDLGYTGINGLPGTLDELYDLFDIIKQAGMIPYISGPSNYWYGTTTAFMAQYEGEDAAKLTYTYDGTYTFDAERAKVVKENVQQYAGINIEQQSYITVNSDGSYTATITPESAYLLAYMPGQEEYVEFCRKVATPGYFDPNMHDTAYNFEKIQSVFVQSVLKKQGQKRIAMIYEGEWWENEARANFNYTGGYGKRDFRFMPIPEIDGQKPTGYSLGTNTAGTHLFVNGKTDKVELCRLWLQFAHSEHALEVFTLSNGAVRNAFKYDLSDTQLATLSKFGQNVYKIKNGLGEYADVKIYAPSAYLDCHNFYNVCPMGGYASELGCSLRGKFTDWASVDGTWGSMYGHAGDMNNEEWTVEEFMEGVYEHYTKNWKGAYEPWANKNA